MEYLPHAVNDLIDQLEIEIPEVHSSPGHSLEDIMFRSGRRSVVLYLLQLREQSPNPLKDDD